MYFVNQKCLKRVGPKATNRQKIRQNPNSPSAVPYSSRSFEHAPWERLERQNINAGLLIKKLWKQNESKSRFFFKFVESSIIKLFFVQTGEHPRRPSTLRGDRAPAGVWANPRPGRVPTRPRELNSVQNAVNIAVVRRNGPAALRGMQTAASRLMHGGFWIAPQSLPRALCEGLWAWTALYKCLLTCLLAFPTRIRWRVDFSVQRRFSPARFWSQISSFQDFINWY